MYPSDVRQKLATGNPVLGTGMFTREPFVAQSIYQTGCDWVWIDQEHQPYGTESIGTICVQGRQAGSAPVIRVPWNNQGDIKKAYDIGAVGVMVPQIDTPEDAKNAVKWAKYPPEGMRGIAPFFASYLGVGAQDIIDNANSETLLLLQMESVEAYENLDEILAIPGYEVLLVGPTDLSASLGVNGQIHNSKVENIMVDVAQRIKGTGKHLATTFADVDDCRRWIGEGYQMMNVSSTLALGTVQTMEIFAESRIHLVIGDGD
jgi:2-keto-3-deoxy-L-rhamnonate aldolase RhmA